MEFGFIIGWVGVGFGLLVPLPQLIKIIKTKRLNDISTGTYIFLVCCISCYLAHAIYIESPVFTVAQSINLTTNSIILTLLIRHRTKKPQYRIHHFE